ncbi:hypothetical protein K1X84_04955 [bacterium]|nr:hypothetical protein [bacterium]
MRYVLWISVLITVACNNPDIEKERRELLKLHERQRTAHLEENIDLLASEQADTLLFIRNGELGFRTNRQMRENFKRYFDRVEFIKWDDIAEPIIEISDDASMASTFVQKIVILSYQNEQGQSVIDTTVFAWTTLYRKRADEWKLIAMTSTQK